jgi:hypothetical protein
MDSLSQLKLIDTYAHQLDQDIPRKILRVELFFIGDCGWGGGCGGAGRVVEAGAQWGEQRP